MPVFDSEILNVVLEFENKGRNSMLQTSKLISEMSLELDNIVRKNAVATRSFDDLAAHIARANAQIAKLEADAAKRGQPSKILHSANQLISFLAKPLRLELMADNEKIRNSRDRDSETFQLGLTKAMQDIASSVKQIPRALTHEIAESGGRRFTKGGLLDFDFNSKTNTREQIAEALKEVGRSKYKNIAAVEPNNRLPLLPFSGRNDVGRGLAIDTETYFSKRLPRSLEAFNQQIVEVTAKVFEYSKATGEVLRITGEAYHGYNDIVKNLGKTAHLPTGIDRGTIAGQSIDVAALNKLINSAELIIGHNIKSFDVPHMMQQIPGLANLRAKPTFDTSADVPWRVHGYQRFRLNEDLARHFNLTAGGEAHRSEGDVERNIQLLGRRFTKGGSTLLGQNLLKQPSLAEQRTPHQSLVVGLINDYNQQITVLKAALGTLRKTPLLDIEQELDTEGRLHDVHRPAAGKSGLKLSGGTPSYIGERGIAMEQRLSDMKEFVSNAELHGSPQDAAKLAKLYEAALERQWNILVAKTEAKKPRKDEVVLAEDLSLKAILSVNRILEEQRSGITDRSSEHRERTVNNGQVAQTVEKWGAEKAAIQTTIDRLQGIGYVIGQGNLFETTATEASPQYLEKLQVKLVKADEMLQQNQRLLLGPGEVWEDRKKLEGEFRESRRPKIDTQAPQQIQDRQQTDQERYDRMRGVIRQAADMREGLPSFTDEEIATFAKKHVSELLGITKAIVTAAQMAAQVGEHSPHYGTLVSAIRGAQSANKRAKYERGQQKVLDIDNEPVELRFTKINSKARDRIAATKARAGSIPLDSLLSLFGFRSRKSSSSYQAEQTEYKARAGRGFGSNDIPFPEGGDLRGSMRRDALEQKLKKFGEAVSSAGEEFIKYRDVIARSRKEEANSKLLKDIDKNLVAQAQNKARSEYQLDSITDQKARATKLGGRRLDRIDEAMEGAQSGLGLAELEAESAYSAALARQGLEKKKIAKQEKRSSFENIPEIRRQSYEEDLQAITKPAELKLLRARFARQSSGVVDEQELEKLRQSYGTKASLALWGTQSGSVKYLGQDRSLDDLRKEYKDRVIQSVGGKSIAQKGEARGEQAAEDTEATVARLDARKKVVQDRQTATDDKLVKQQIARRTQWSREVNKIDDDVVRRQDRVRKKAADNEEKAHQARLKFVKTEALRGGGGGGEGTGSGSESDGKFGVGGGSGLDVALLALTAYDAGLKELIRDTAVYAAKTQLMAVVTDQMARVNGLNVDQVEAEVQAIKKLNITTQDAYSTVQKMIFAQLDVGKSTDIARVAQNLSVVSGKSASETLNSLMQGIVTGQTRILHNMGLQVSLVSTMRELRVEKKSRGEQGEPTELEKRQAMFQKVLQEGAKYTGTFEQSLSTVGARYKLLQTDIAETGNAIGKEFLPAFSNAVNFMSSAFVYINKNSEAFAHLATVLASVGTAASVLKGAAFLGIPGGPLVKIGALLAGVAAAKLLEPNAAATAGDTADKQRTMLQKTVQDLAEERKGILARRTGGADWQASLDLNTTSMQSAASRFVDINKDLTISLAEEYEKRLQDFKDYQDALFGHKGFWAGAGAYAGVALKALTGGAVDITPRSAKPGDISREAGGTVSDADIQAQSKLDEQTLKARALAGGPMLNQADINAQNMASKFISNEVALEKLEEKLNPAMGTLARQARKAMGSPRQKISIDEAMAVEQVNSRFLEYDDLEKRRKSPDVRVATAAEQEYNLFLNKLAKGGPTPTKDTIRQGKAVFEQAKASRQDDIDEIHETYAPEYAKLSARTKFGVMGTQAEFNVDKIRAATIQGNYDSERKEALETYNVKQKLSFAELKLLGDTDEYQKQIAANAAGYASALVSINAKVTEASRQRRQGIKEFSADFAAQDILNAPGDPREALMSGFQGRMRATKGDTNDESRIAKQIQLTQQLAEALRELGLNKAKLAAETDISIFEDQGNVQDELDRITSTTRFGPRSEGQRNLGEIERTRQRGFASAEYSYSRSFSVTPASQQAALSAQKDSALRKAQDVATVDTAKELQTQVVARKQELSEVFHRQFGDISKINEAKAIGLAEEQAAAHNTHIEQMAYIELEAKAREDTVENEKQKRAEMHQSEMEELTRLLAIRKQQVEELKNFAGTIFDTMVLDQKGQRGQHAHDFAITASQDLGRTIFKNIVSTTLSDKVGGLGKIIPGQETKDAQGKITPTFLGKILSGTPFGISHTEDIPRLQADLTKDNTKAIGELTKQIAELQEALRGEISSAGGPLATNEDIFRNQIPMLGVGAIPGGPAPGTIQDYALLTNALGAGPGSSGTVGTVGGYLSSIQTAAEISASAAQKVGSAIGTSGTAGIAVAAASSVPGVIGSLGAISKIFSGSTSSVASTSASLGTDIYGNAIPAIGVAGGPAGATPPGGIGTLASILKGPALGTTASDFGKGLGNTSDWSGVFSGYSKATDPMTGEQTSTPISGAQRVGEGVGMAGVAIGGAMSAISSFKQGGARGALGGTAAILGTAAALDPEPLSKAILSIAALGTTLARTFMPDPRVERQKQIQQELDSSTYNAPEALNVTQDTAGNYTSIDSHGGIHVSAGLSAMPQVAEPYTHFWRSPGAPLASPYQIPGNVLSPYTPRPNGPVTSSPIFPPTPSLPGTPGGVTPTSITIHLSAIDTQSGVQFLQKNTGAVADIIAGHLQNNTGRLSNVIRKL